LTVGAHSNRRFPDREVYFTSVNTHLLQLTPSSAVD
jgi:hypothetical protein